MLEFDNVTLLLATVAAMLVAAGAVAFRLRARRNFEEAAYVRRRPLKSYEQSLYWRLVKVLPDHVILVQIPMSRCVTMKGPHAATLARETLDFVLCNRAMRILAVIEVEDESRPISDQRMKIAQLKEEALAAAGIRLLRCSPHGLLSEGYIAMEFKSESVSRLAA